MAMHYALRTSSNGYSAGRQYALPLRYVENQVRERFSAARWSGVGFEQRLDFRQGRDVLRLYLRWKEDPTHRRHVAVYFDYTLGQVRAEPGIGGVDLEDMSLAWLDALLCKVPGAPRPMPEVIAEADASRN